MLISHAIFKTIVCLLSLVLVSTTIYAQEAGKVLLAIGSALVQDQQGQKPLQVGGTVSVGDIISTQRGAYVHIRMLDGGLLAIRPESKLTIEVFDYNPASPASGRVRYHLHHGVGRSVTGAIGQANKKAFRFNTPLAAIGVRGTDFVVATTGEQTRVSVSQGAIVIAPLGTQCSATEFGSCAVNALLLAATTPGYAELDIRQPVPRLRQDMENSPDQQMPAHPSEPSSLNEDKRSLAASLPPLVPATVAPSVVYWGRWNPDLQNVNGATIEELAALGKKPRLANWLFGLGVDNMPARLPKSGQVSFNLYGGDAYVRTTAGLMQPASLLGGSLGVNFSTSQFQVNTDVRALDQTHQLHAAGPVEIRGYLMADPTRSNAVINTVLGEDLTQAGSLFTKPLDNGSTLLGAITWRR